MSEFMMTNCENPNLCRSDIDITKNFLQMMIWAHNRRSTLSLTAISNEIEQTLKLGRITWHEADTLQTIVTMFIQECKEAKNGATVAQGSDTVSTKTAIAGSMARVLLNSEGDCREGCPESYSG